VPWIIRKKTLPPIVRCLPLSYTFLSYYNGLLKILQKAYKFALSVARPRAKKLSASGGLRPPDQGLCPWTPLGLRPQTPVIGSRSTRSPCAPQKNCPWPPLFQYSGAGADTHARSGKFIFCRCIALDRQKVIMKIIHCWQRRCCYQ